MVEGTPYIPYILRDIKDKMNEYFQTLTEPITVYFDYGLQADVSKRVYNKKTNAQPTYPLIWLVINTLRIRRERPDMYGEATFDLILAMPTDPKYTSEQRSEFVFKAALYPVYDQLLTQISECPNFLMPAKNAIPHTPLEKHYWGGTENGNDAQNLFKDFIDAIQIKDMKLDLDANEEEMNILN